MARERNRRLVAGVIRLPLAADPLRQSRHAFPASGWVDEHGVVGDAAFERAPALVRVLLVPGAEVRRLVTQQARNLSFTGLFAKCGS